jgi:hypothetical protein
MKNTALILAAALTLTACAPTMKLAPAGAFQTPSHIAVNLDHNWTHVPPALNASTNGSALTRHGLALNRVDLISIAPGEAIIRVDRRTQAPRFQQNLSAPELVELVTASLARMGYTNVQTADVRPTQLGGAEGIRFSLTGAYQSGLNMRGDVALAQANGKLNVIMYTAPAAHYFEANALDFEHMIQSAHFS